MPRALPPASSRPVLSGVIALSALVLTLTACTAPGADTSASAAQAASFPAVYAQQIAWEACDEDRYGLIDNVRASMESSGVDTSTFQCAMIEAPLDWSNASDDATISLAVTRIPATGDAPIGSLLVNPGGPGQSGTSLAFGLTTGSGIAAVRENYDLVGFDPRGIGRSTPLTCASTSTIQAVNLSECARAQPLALSMGTSQVARDMELLRSLLHDEKMHYLGYSYGTALGATYSTIFPERVGRMVLDSALSGDWASPTQTFDQSHAIAEQMVAMLQACPQTAQVSACPVTSEDGLLETIAALSETPLMAANDVEVTGATVYGYLLTALYSGERGRAPRLDAFARALSGEQDSIDDIAQAMNGGGAAVNDAGVVVRCHSFPADPDIAGLVAHIAQVGLPKLLGGPEITDDSIRPFADLSCDALPNSGDDITDSFSGSPDAPMLVIGITGDHATPYSGARSLTEQLGNARLLTLDGVGHGASYAWRSPCIDDATTAYLVQGTLPEPGAVCAESAMDTTRP